MEEFNILVRTKKGREHYLSRCLMSIETQSEEVDTLIHKDTDGFHPDSTSPFFYNLFCNDLKSLVKSGYFLFLDDDDFLHNHFVIQDVLPKLMEDRANIVQMWRDDTGCKPFDMHMDSGQIVEGKIGMPCIILHAKHKNIADFDDSETADFKFIQTCIEKLGGNFIKQIVVNSPHRNYGQ
jgi:hypothetical protein